MAYQRLIFCLDKSGSMSGDKIANSVKYLNEIADAFNCTTNYFLFGCDVYYSERYDINKIDTNDGTCIEKCLNKLFNDKLRGFSGNNERTKFIFVTDACDRIDNVAASIASKQQCQAAFNNQLHCYCLLVGGGGGCSKELKQIFGDQSFDQVTNANFANILKKVSGNNKIAQKLATVDMQNIKGEIDQLTKSNNSDIVQFGNKMTDIVNKVTNNKTKIEVTSNKIDESKQKLQDIVSETNRVQQDVNRAHSEPEIDAATASIRNLKKQNRAQNNRLNVAGRELDASSQALKTEADRAEEIANKLKSNNTEINQKSTAIIANIIGAIKELQNITTGAYEQVQHLKTEFTKQLDDLMQVIDANNSLAQEFEECQSQIEDTFTKLKRGKINLDGCKKLVVDNMKRLNDLLEQLDNK